MDIRPGAGSNNAEHQERLRGSRSAFVYARPHAVPRGSSVDGMRVTPVTKPVSSINNKPAAAHDIKQQVLQSKPAPIKQFHQVSQLPPLPKLHTPALHTNKPRPALPRQARSGVLKRQSVKTKTKSYKALKHRRPLMPTLMSAMAVILFTVGLLVVFSTLRTNHTVKAQVKQLSHSTEEGITSETPSEDDPPVGHGSYKVAPDLPRILTIDKIGVNARVTRLGVGPDNTLKAPSNIFDVGWYDGSAKPGENGTIVLDGHVSGPTKHGVFYSIGTLKVGDKVKLERGDGKVFTYSVTGTQVYDNDKVDMAKVMTTSVLGKPALNFMTCTGRFNVRTNQFEQRVVVFTVQD